MPKDEFHKQTTLSGASPSEKGISHSQEIPKTIGPYPIESILETGGMSIIYLGMHPDTKDPTTIKVLLPKYLSNPEVVQRFLNEAEIIAMTDHPNIIKLYGHGEWERGLYIAMEFIQGSSLRQTLLQTPLSLKRALEIVVDIAYALCHLHTHGVIHRDLKPENILITDDGQIKVIDFGIAQLLTEQAPSGAPTKQRLIGTPIYMSPEQRENPENVSYPSDIYSLGIITYELVLGKLSHGQIHLSLMPKGLQKILNKALQPNPKDRYQDIVDFITDISSYLNSSNMQKEKIAGDQFSEIMENLRKSQGVLIPEKMPDWPGIDIGLSSFRGLQLHGTFYDFLNFPDGSYGIVIGEPLNKGAESVVYTAVLRGMTHALWRLTNQPAELAGMLNNLLISEKVDQLFAFNCIVLSPKENQLNYISCALGSLWKVNAGTVKPIKINNDNPSVGSKTDAVFNSTTTSWNINDRLILASFRANAFEKTVESNVSDQFFEDIIENNPDSSSQRMGDTILRKVTLSLLKPTQERALTLFLITRNQ